MARPKKNKVVEPTPCTGVVYRLRRNNNYKYRTSKSKYVLSQWVEFYRVVQGFCRCDSCEHWAEKQVEEIALDPDMLPLGGRRVGLYQLRITKSDDGDLEGAELTPYTPLTLDDKK